jgi:phospho-N-acetylmuramoyl-pentapeptide-transferase
MVLYLSLLLFSFAVNSALIVPFINLLYKIKFYRRHQITKDFLEKRAKIFDRLHRKKAGTPVGGGILILVTLIIFYLSLIPSLKLSGFYISACYPINEELNIILFTFVSFGLLGLYDDLMKFFNVKKTGFFGLRMRHKFIIQMILGVIIGLLLYVNLGIDFINIPFYGLVRLGWIYVPLAALIVVSFANAFNITDGLDGLSSGLLMIFLFAFWIISFNQIDTLLSVLISLWIGGVLAFLYFNIYPARIMLGDVGALAFGAAMGVIGLLTGKIVAFLVIGAPFLIELSTSFLQIISKKFRKKKLFAIAPFHLWLQNKGWEEPKIVMRAWLAGIIFAVLGLWLSQL